MGRVFSVFTFLAILIAGLGLFALASFTTELRTKEIGIRKVLGADVPGIVVLLSKQFAKWVILANVIAWPTAYFIMRKWLEGFAYRTQMGILTFVTATVLALLSRADDSKFPGCKGSLERAGPVAPSSVR